MAMVTYALRLRNWRHFSKHQRQHVHVFMQHLVHSLSFPFIWLWNHSKMYLKTNFGNSVNKSIVHWYLGLTDKNHNFVCCHIFCGLPWNLDKSNDERTQRYWTQMVLDSDANRGGDGIRDRRLVSVNKPSDHVRGEKQELVQISSKRDRL